MRTRAPIYAISTVELLCRLDDFTSAAFEELTAKMDSGSHMLLHIFEMAETITVRIYALSSLVHI